jgi:DNA-binding NtrC family response regulator
MDESEKIILRDTLASCQGNKSKAADMLGIGRKTLHRKLAEMGEGEGDEE